MPADVVAIFNQDDLRKIILALSGSMKERETEEEFLWRCVMHDGLVHVANRPAKRYMLVALPDDVEQFLPE
jgi:hypothetical protein